MNAKTQHKLRFGLEVARLMKVRKLKIVSNIFVCTLIFIGGWNSGAWSLAIPSMAIVQSVNFPEMIEAYKEAQAQQPPIQYNENDPTRRKQ